MRERIHPAMHAGFFLLLAASASRYVVYHGLGGQATLILGLSGALALAYGIGLFTRFAGRWWLTSVIAIWLALVVIAPSFAWCAIPLFLTSLRMFPPRYSVPVLMLLTAAVGTAEFRLADRFDPSLLLGPLAVAGLTAAVFLELDGRNRELIAARDALTDSERAAGALAERQRLSREIHDTLAQGLSSMNLLLQAADQEWESDRPGARAHVAQAADTARENLAEARRFVRDLAPPALDRGTIVEALARLTAPTGRFEVVGDPYPLGVEIDVALLRVAQGALANVTAHAGGARTVAVTLTYLPAQVALDVRDDGVGFTPSTATGYGLTGIRDRVGQLGGTVVVESAPGEGTALAVAIPTSIPILAATVSTPGPTTEQESESDPGTGATTDAMIGPAPGSTSGPLSSPTSGDNLTTSTGPQTPASTSSIPSAPFTDASATKATPRPDGRAETER